MKSNYKLPYQEAVRIVEVWREVFLAEGSVRYKKDFLKECGLVSSNKDFYFLSSKSRESYLYISNPRLFLLAKLKYNF